MRLLSLIGVLLASGCTTVRYHHEIEVLQDKTPYYLTIEKTEPIYPLATFCGLTGIFYGGACWLYLGLPYQEDYFRLSREGHHLVQNNLKKLGRDPQYSLVSERIRYSFRSMESSQEVYFSQDGHRRKINDHITSDFIEKSSGFFLGATLGTPYATHSKGVLLGVKSTKYVTTFGVGNEADLGASYSLGLAKLKGNRFISISYQLMEKKDIDAIRRVSLGYLQAGTGILQPISSMKKVIRYEIGLSWNTFAEITSSDQSLTHRLESKGRLPFQSREAGHGDFGFYVLTSFLFGI